MINLMTHLFYVNGVVNFVETGQSAIALRENTRTSTPTFPISSSGSRKTLVLIIK